MAGCYEKKDELFAQIGLCIYIDLPDTLLGIMTKHRHIDRYSSISEPENCLFVKQNFGTELS